MRVRFFLPLLLLALLCVACGEDVPGVMLVISAPAELEDEVSALRVIVRSGLKGDGFEERGDETVDVSEWPAEVFLRATNVKRSWRAEVWGLNEDGENIAGGAIEGWFMTGRPLRLSFSIRALTSDDADAGPPSERRDAGATDATVPDTGAATIDAGRDAAMAQQPGDAGGTTMRDTGTSAPRDSGTSTPVDSGSQTPLDSGSQTPLDSGSQTPLDSGSQTPLDSGTQPQPQPDAGGGTTGSMCAAAPAYSTASECGKCTCMRCATQITSCYASTDAAKNRQCAAVRSCAEKNNCIGTGCYCGSSLLCLSPDGPCLQEYETAAGGAGLTAVQTASTDPENPVGRSVPVGECQMQNCQRECGL